MKLPPAPLVSTPDTANTVAMVVEQNAAIFVPYLCIWCCVVLSCLVLCFLLWCGVLCFLLWCGVVWCGVVWCAEGAVTKRQKARMSTHG